MVDQYPGSIHSCTNEHNIDYDEEETGLPHCRNFAFVSKFLSSLPLLSSFCSTSLLDISTAGRVDEPKIEIVCPYTSIDQLLLITESEKLYKPIVTGPHDNERGQQA